MSWKNWNFNQICLLGLKYHYLYSMSRGHPESYIMEKLCLMNSLARFLLFLVYDNHLWPKNTVRTSFFPKFKKMTMNLNQYYNKQNPPVDVWKSVRKSVSFFIGRRWMCENQCCVVASEFSAFFFFLKKINICVRKSVLFGCISLFQLFSKFHICSSRFVWHCCMR